MFGPNRSFILRKGPTFSAYRPASSMELHPCAGSSALTDAIEAYETVRWPDGKVPGEKA
jgi:hypothetical protein